MLQLGIQHTPMLQREGVQWNVPNQITRS